MGLQQVLDHLRKIPIMRERFQRPSRELAELFLNRDTYRPLHAIHFSLQFVDGRFRLGGREQGAVLHEPLDSEDRENFDENDSGLLYTICIRCPDANFGGLRTGA